MLNEFPFDKLTDVEVIAIEQASHGLISGYLEEWPYVRDAMKKLGLPSHKRIEGAEVRTLCKLIVKVWK